MSSLLTISEQVKSGITASKPLPEAINVFLWPAPPVGLIKIKTPLSSFSPPIPHFSPTSVAYSQGSYPSKSSTIRTTIWLEVESLKAFNFSSIDLASEDERKSGNSNDRLL